MAAGRSEGEGGGRLARFGLGSPQARAWALYDWANSAMITVVVAAVYPVYYAQVAGAELGRSVASSRFALATTISLALTAVAAPVLGVLADRARMKKRLLATFLALGAAATALLATVGHGDWLLGAGLFVLANVGAAGSFVFYDALLPHVARERELDRLSTSAFALGYLGGGLFLGLGLVLIERPGWFGLPSGEGLTALQQSLPARVVFLLTALWWVAFSIPLFLRVPEPPAVAGTEERARTSPAALLREAVRELGRGLRGLRGYPEALLLLVAFLIYNDGISTIIRLGAIYGDEVGVARGDLILAFLLVQFVGIPCTLLFGGVARRFGAKPSVLVTLVVYAGITLLAWRTDSAADFYALAIGIACVQGGAQALSRSLFASLVPRQRSAEFFGLFAVLDRFAGILGPALFALLSWATGSSRTAILPLLAFFLVGGALLARVDVAAGRARARAAERELERAAGRAPEAS